MQRGNAVVKYTLGLTLVVPTPGAFGFCPRGRCSQGARTPCSPCPYGNGRVPVGYSVTRVAGDCGQLLISSGQIIYKHDDVAGLLSPCASLAVNMAMAQTSINILIVFPL